MGLLIINPANDSFVTDMKVGVAFGISVASCGVAVVSIAGCEGKAVSVKL